MKRIILFLIFALALNALLSSLDASDDAGASWSLYGYVVNYTAINFYITNNGFDSIDAGNVLYTRFKGDWNPSDALEFHAEISLDYRHGNQNPYGLFQELGLFDQTLFPADNFIETITVDHVWGLANLGPFDLRFGKMPLAWGTGYLFNPTSRVVFSGFMDNVSEETPGIIALEPAFYIADFMTITGYACFQERTRKVTAFADDGNLGNIPYGIKLKGVMGAYDLSLCWIKEVVYRNDVFNRSYYLGFDFAGGLWDLDIYGEGVLNFPMDESQSMFRFEGHEFKDILEACAGLSCMIPGIELESRLEYYHQGLGVNDKSHYDVTKILSGELMLQGEDYLFIHLSKTFIDYLQCSLSGFVNINDLSFVILPQITYDVFDDFQISLGGMIFFGGEGTEFNGVYPFGLQTIDVMQPSCYTKFKLSF
ncbi:MAG: hypothetical protein JW969_10190 [Spirochaetales bacterium]|nr:hypothetical protein [Spirochaetales bacterium]